ALQALRQGQDKSVGTIAGSRENNELRVSELGHELGSRFGSARHHRGPATAASPAVEDWRGGAFAVRAGAIRPRARHTRSAARRLQADKHPSAPRPPQVASSVLATFIGKA